MEFSFLKLQLLDCLLQFAYPAGQVRLVCLADCI
jgi:hypothetical protein